LRVAYAQGGLATISVSKYGGHCGTRLGDSKRWFTSKDCHRQRLDSRVATSILELITFVKRSCRRRREKLW
jgi:hypothetical protein